MKTRVLLVLILGSSLLALGCGRGGDPSAETTLGGAPEVVPVAASGTLLEPPVPPEKLPDGVWYCAGSDCGGAHWAAARPPTDAACPTCSSPLERKEASVPSGGGVCAPGE